MDDYIRRADALKLLREKINLDTFMRRGVPNAMKSLGKICEGLEAIPSANVHTPWNMIESRPMDDEEREEWSERMGHELEDFEAIIYSNLPNHLQEVLVASKYGTVYVDTFRRDINDGCYFEDNGDMDGIIAWMPLPNPPKEWSGT